MLHPSDPPNASASTSSGVRSVAARDVVGSTIFTGDVHFSALGTLAWDCSGRIANFLRQYIGTPGEPVTFGGRDGEMAALDAWLRDELAPPYLLFAAPAGRGKSALLAQWVHGLRQDGEGEGEDGVRVIFFPVSIRYRTNLAGVVFPVLAAQLAKVHGGEVGGSVQLTPEMWRGLVGEYLTRPLPGRRRLLVVLDGLDEAADWKAGPDIFPLTPPPGLRVVASARLTTYAPTPRAWLERLGWEVPRLATTPGLPPLTVGGVADVLRHVGFSLPDPAQHDLLVRELHRLSEGDPLLVRLYVDELRRGTPRPAGLTPVELAALDPGLEGYFNRWWDDQRLLWDRDAPLREPAVRTLLNLLACALAPLRQEDLLNLAPDELGLGTWALEDALQPLERFVVGDGRSQGYVFSHPKLGQYFYERLAQPERAAWDQRFLAWGGEVLAALDSGELAPAEVPPYLLQYLGVHLERAGGEVDALLALVARPWLQAWLETGAGISGFLADVSRAWRAAARENTVRARKGEPVSGLAAEALCGLCHGSDSSRASRVSPALLEALVESGLWNPLEGLVYARRFDPSERVVTFSRLLPLFPADEQVRLLREALALASEGRTHDAVAHALCVHWTRLAPAERADMQEAVLLLAARQASVVQRVRTLVTVAGALEPALAERAIQDALRATPELASIIDRAQALALIAQAWPGAGRTSIADVLREAARSEPGARLRVAAALLPALDGETRERVVAALIDGCGPRCCVNTPYDALVLARIVPHVAEPWRAEMAAVVMGWVHQDELLASPHEATGDLAGLVAFLPPGGRSAVAEKATLLLSRLEWREYPHLLDVLLETLPEPERGALLAREVDAARQGARDTVARLALYRYLDPADRRRLAGELRQDAGLESGILSILDEGPWQRLGPAIREVGVRDTSLRAVIESRLRIDDEAGLLATAAIVLPRLSSGLRGEIEPVLLRVVEELPEATRARVLGWMAGVLSRPGLRAVLGMANALPPAARARVLAALFPHLPRAARRRQALALWRMVERMPSVAGPPWRLRMRDLSRADALDRSQADLLVAALPYLPLRRKEHAAARLIEIAGRTRRARRVALLLRTLPHAGEARAGIAVDLALELFRAQRLRLERPRYTAAAARLAGVMAGGGADETLSYARQIPRPGDRAMALAALVPWLDEECRMRVAAEAVSLSRRLPSSFDRAALWYGVAVHLSRPGPAAALLRRALREMEPLDPPIAPARAALVLAILVALLPHLSGLERHTRIGDALRIGEQAHRLSGGLVRDLAAQAPQEDAAALLQRFGYANGMHTEDKMALAGQMTADQVEYLLGTVRRSTPARRRTRLLAALPLALSPWLQVPERLEINDFHTCAGRPAPFGEDDLPGMEIEVIRSLVRGDIAAGALAEAARMLEGRPRAEQYRVLHERLHAAAKHSRATVLRLIESHAAVFASLDPGCLDEVVRSMFRVREWWP